MKVARLREGGLRCPLGVTRAEASATAVSRVHSTGGGRGVSGTSNVHGGFLSPLLSPEEVRRVQAGGVPRLEHFLLYQKQITWTLSLSGLTRKMEGLLPPWDWEMGKNGTGGRWGNVKAVN